MAVSGGIKNLRVRLEVTVNRAAVAVGFPQFDTDEIQLPMPHAAFGDDFLGKFPHVFNGAFENDALDTLVMIQMRMHRGDGQIVMRVLDRGQPLSKFAFVMVINVGQVGDARALDVALQATLLQMAAQNIAHSLTARRIATLLDEFIEGVCQLLVERYREAIHDISTMKDRVNERRTGSTSEKPGR